MHFFSSSFTILAWTSTLVHCVEETQKILKTDETSQDIEQDLVLKFTPQFYSWSNGRNGGALLDEPFIDVSMTMEASSISHLGPILSMPLALDGVILFPPNITAIDDQGDLPLNRGALGLPVEDRWQWTTSRTPNGSVEFFFRVYPYDTNDSDPKTFYHLRHDQESMMGTLVTLLPQPPRWYTWHCTVMFDMWHLPLDFRGVWSWGEYHPLLKPYLRHTGSIEEIINSVIAMGSLNRYPGELDAADSFGAYWVGEPQSLVPEDLALYTHRLSSEMSFFFDDVSREYRMFIARNPYHFSSGLHRNSRSVIVAYTNGTDPPAEVMKEEIAKALVHSWPQLVQLGRDHIEELNQWFNDGISFYYSSLLPFKSGLQDLDTTIALLNRYAAAYYTSPGIIKSNSDLVILPPTSESVRMVSAYRGFLYLINTAHTLSRQTRAQSLDNIILGIVHRRRVGLHDDMQTWKNTMVFWLGQSGASAFDSMLAGDFLEVQPKALAYLGLEARPRDLFAFELGFPEECLDTSVEKGKVIHELVRGSRAEESGLKNGDVVINHTSTTFRPLYEDYDARMNITVRRHPEGDKSGWKTMTFIYWPRSFHKVKGWSFERVDSIGEL